MSVRHPTKTVFVCSTFADLLEHREAVRRAIHRIQHHADDMIYWSAEGTTAQVASVRHVQNADVVILLVAHRYGEIPKGESRSTTEMEFDAAIDAGVPVLAFLVDPEYPWPPNHIEIQPAQRDRLNEFKEKIAKLCTHQLFMTPEILEANVSQALANLDSKLLV